MEGCEGPANLAKVTRWCESLLKTPSTALFLALFTERDELKLIFEASGLRYLYISGLDTDGKKLRKKVAEHKKIDATAKGVS